MAILFNDFNKMLFQNKNNPTTQDV